MDRPTNGGGDEGWVGRWTGVRMGGVGMRDWQADDTGLGMGEIDMDGG